MISSVIDTFFLPSPQYFGCPSNIFDKSTPVVDWIDGTPAPAAVLELLSCQCKKVCSNDCPGVSKHLKCNHMCRLLNCNNCSDDYGESTEHLENYTLDLAGDVKSDEEDESGESDEEAFMEPLLCPEAQYEVEVDTKNAY